jgi:lipoprotein-anchoring transpeptidase ErfK/SrfK
MARFADIPEPDPSEGSAPGPLESPAPSRDDSSYAVRALAPNNPAAVRVKVSTSTQNVYVLEGDRLLMAVQGCVGANGATPLGNHQIMSKIRDKRSGAFGFDSQGNPTDSHLGQNVAVGYPLAFWCEFAPGYGFHEGFVWSEPRTHGCVRLHKEAAARLFQLVRTGTPVNIAVSQPEDQRYGHLVVRLDQRHDPDPPVSLLMSSSWFVDPPGPLLVKE